MFIRIWSMFIYVYFKCSCETGTGEDKVLALQSRAQVIDMNP